MNKNLHEVSAKFGDETITIESGKWAKQANGSVLVKCGGCVVIVTVVGYQDPKPGADFFPLLCDYREKSYAAGKFPGGYFKREARPTDKETLTSRLMDRPIRPMFADDYSSEVQVSATVLSTDCERNADVLAMLGSSAALMISEIPFTEAIGCCRVGLVGDDFVVNPTYKQLEESSLDLIVSASEKNIVMIESSSTEISEAKMLEAIVFAHKSIQTLLKLQSELVKKCGKKKWPTVKRTFGEGVEEKIEKVCKGEFSKINLIQEKIERQEAINALNEKVLAEFDVDSDDFNAADVKYLFHEVEKREVRGMIVKDKKRPDGRGFDDVRPIECEIGVLPRTHGSGLFTRGQTQALVVATLGTRMDEQLIDGLEEKYYKKFLLHYNFPSYSVGEIGFNRGPGRREIGHGALAERSMLPVLPDAEDFPYTIRVVSEIMESNGSSSMASVCGASLSLMDAGVPIKAPVAGVAMGLVKQGDDWAVLTDIQGVEDHLGDMDFKVTGTREGINALQMDIKIKGITPEIMEFALQKAKETRFKILDIMESTIDKPRDNVAEFAPRIHTIMVKTEKIKDIIGPGGKNIKKLIEETGAKIDIDDTGKVCIAATDTESMDLAIEKINQMVEEPEIGKIYEAKVRKIMNFGAFCEIIPGTDGLCHVSELTSEYVKNVEDVVKEGDMITVKVIGIDERGKINLSAKQVKAEVKDEVKEEK